MSAAFDPYHKWLGIPPEEQPASLYRLLGIRQFEADRDVIDSAADQRMTHLRTFQSGKHASLSQKLLNEISRARQRLLDPEEKSEYDAQLRGQPEPKSGSKSSQAKASAAAKSAAPAGGGSASGGKQKTARWPENRAPATLDEFHECLAISGLMSAEESRQFLAELPAGKQPSDPKALATELARAGKLTRYQAGAVLQGKLKFLSFGEYTIVEKLGQGGMGQVLKAEHRRMRRMVALKLMATASMKDPDAVRRFQREVHAAARLIHPNIVTAFDANEHEGVHFFVMEYVEGKDLGAVVKEKGPLPMKAALAMGRSMASVYSRRHELGAKGGSNRPLGK
jgi:hypothetical protein